MSTHKEDSRAGSESPVRLRRILWGVLLGLVCVLGVGTITLGQSGSLYDLHWYVLSGGGGPAEGTHYRINYSFGQPSTIGDSGGTDYQLRQGYWQKRIATPTPTPTPTCEPINPVCQQERINGCQPNRYETVRPIFNDAASNSLGTTAAPVYPTIRSAWPPEDTEVSPTQPIPHIVLRGISWQESRWKQFADNKDENPDDTYYCTLMSEKVDEGDCGYGLMQVTSCMRVDDGCDWPQPWKIAGELVWNLGRGVTILLEKWNSRSYDHIIDDNDHTIPENWYYAVTSYQWWGWKNSPNNTGLYDPWRPPYYDEAGVPKPPYPYQEVVWSQMAHPKDPTTTEIYRPYPLWRLTRVPWVPRGIWGLSAGEWEPAPSTSKPVFHSVWGIHVDNGTTGPTIVLHNTTPDTLAVDVALYNADHTFNRWWLGFPPPQTPAPPIKLEGYEIRPLAIADAFEDDPPENFTGYARISANEGVEVTLQPPPPQPLPPGFHVFLPVAFKNFRNLGNCYDAFQVPQDLNGDFETLYGYGQPASWMVSSVSNYPLVDSTWFYEGHYGAYVGGYNDPDDQFNDVDDDLKQDQVLSIPPNHSAYLVYDWYMQSEEYPGDDVWDFFYVRLRDGLGTEIATLKAESNMSARDVWQRHWIDLSDYAGQSGLYLHFEADIDSSYPTGFFIDNVQLWICTP